MKYTVRYTWQGQTYRHSRDFATLREAQALAAEMKADRWRAWACRI
jgi:hypothetical protein